MITIYHIEGRRSERVAWLLEEIGGMPYELDYVAGDILGSLLKLEKTHETRMAPILKDGEKDSSLRQFYLLTTGECWIECIGNFGDREHRLSVADDLG